MQLLPFLVQSVCRTHGNTSDSIISQMLCYFHDQSPPSFRGILIASLISGSLPVKLDIQYGTDNLRDLSSFYICHFFLLVY